MARAAAALLLLALIVGGCRHDGGDPVARSELRELVLQPADVPGFQLFDVGPQLRADTPPPPRSEPGRFGRQDGWKARYRRAGSPQTKGPLVVESRVDVFGDADGAAEELDAFRDEVAAGTARVVDVPEIGDETVAVGQRVVSGDLETRFFAIMWREGRFAASITANGFRGFALEDAVALARKQQARLVARD